MPVPTSGACKISGLWSLNYSRDSDCALSSPNPDPCIVYLNPVTVPRNRGGSPLCTRT